MSPPEASIRDTRALRRRNAVKIPNGGQALQHGVEPKLVPNPNRGTWLAIRARLNFEE